MRLVVDANILFSSLIKDSSTRRIILLDDFELFTPKYVFIELEKHIDYIQKKSNLNKKNIELLVKIIMTDITVIPLDEYKKYIPKAYSIMKNIDEDDTAFLAAALYLKIDGIWSNDPHFSKQDKIRTYTTKDLVMKLNL